METFSASGDGTSSHLSQTPNNMTVPLDAILKDKEILTYEGTFESNWKQSSPCLQTCNGQISAHHQQNNKTCLRKSTVSIHRQTGQSTAVAPRENCPQHESKHFCSNERAPETSAIGEALLLQKCPIQLSSSSFECQSASCVSSTTNISQQSMPHMIVLKSNNLGGSWKNSLHNHQHHVKITNNLPKDSTCQGLFTNVGHFGVILAQGQSVKLCQQNSCMPKDVCQQKYAPQKAVAIVTPLTQHVVADVTFTKNLTNVKEGGLDTRSVPNTNDHQPYILHTLQPTNNESGAKTLCDNTLQTNEAPSKLVLATGFSHCVKDNEPAVDNKLPGQNERLSSIPFNSATTKRKEAVQPYPTDNNCSVALLSKDDATVTGTETRIDAGMDNLSTIPVKEWSLQGLHTLITDLELMEKKKEKELPFNDAAHEILKMYWKGDYQKLCSAAKSNLYVNIMKGVRLHCGTENSVILHEFSEKRLNKMTSRFHVLEHGIAPPKMVYTSSWLNLPEEFYDIDKGDDCLSSLLTTHHRPEAADKEVPVKEMVNIQEPTNKKIKASNKVPSGGQKQSKPLQPEHQKNLRVKGDKTVRKEPVVINVENTCSVKRTEGENSMTVKNVEIKIAQSEKQKPKDENEASLLGSSSTEPSDVSDSCLKPGNLLKLPSTDTNPVLDKNGVADCIPAKMSILPQEKTARLFTGEPNEEVDNMQKEDAQSLTDSKGEVSVELVDQEKNHMDSEIKPDEWRSKIKINWQLESYCCLAKWFHVLGYRNGGLCKCEKKADLSHHPDTSGKAEQEVKAIKHGHPFNKACNVTGTDICELRDIRQMKNRLGYRSMTGNKSITSSTDDASMDEFKIVDVVTNYEDVLKMANEMSEQLMETPLSSTGREHQRYHKNNTTSEFKTGDTQINLTLFGTCHLSQKKRTSAFTSADKLQLPPETINVRIDSGWNKSPNNSKKQTPKQQVWNSWKKTYVPLKTKSKRRKPAKAPETQNDAADNSPFDLLTVLLSHGENSQTHPSDAELKNASSDKQKNTDTDHSNTESRKNISSPRKGKIRKLKQNNILASFNPNKRWNYANRRNKPVKSSFKQAQAIKTSTNKLNMGSALNFRVLPESFSISSGSSSTEASQSSTADSGKYYIFLNILCLFYDFMPTYFPPTRMFNTFLFN